MMRQIFALMTGIVGLFLAGGCGGQKLTTLKTEEDFQRALQQPKPVLVDFYKGGCPTCVALEPTLAQLAKDYAGRVSFNKFELMKPYFATTSHTLKDEYNIKYFPTVILFVQGQEFKRWPLKYGEQSYRDGLDNALVLSELKNSAK